MQTNAKTQCTPADMFANIPAMLGFYPQESFVLGFFEPNGHNGFTLGPLARVSIADEQYYEAVFAGINDRPEGTFVFGYAITGDLEEQHIKHGLQALFAAATRHCVSLEAVWAAKTIQTGEPYRLLCGPNANQLAPNTTGISCWDSGEIAPPFASIAFRHLAASGDLPELDREAAYKFFTGKHTQTRRHWAARIAKTGARQGAELVSSITLENGRSKRTFTVAMTSFNALLCRIERQQLDVEALCTDEQSMEYAAAYWSYTLLRDATLAAVEGPYAKALGKLALAAARTFNGTLKANALCIFAVTTLAGNIWVRALPAIRVALDEVPEHRFAELLHEAVLTGLGRVALESCIRASKQIALRYGEEIPDAA